MRILIQRVKEAKVTVEKVTHGKIQKGLLVFLGIHKDDELKDTKWLSEKLVHLRIFSDKEGKMNLSLLDIQGDALIISQFTLYGDCSMGRRPSFIQSMEPAGAKKIYDQFVQEVKNHLGKVQTGVFGAKMEVDLINDGPVTFLIEGKDL